jgi:Luciferase-like monooxygenase
MKLSVLEQSSLSEGSSAAEAISNTVALSKELDRLGYSRIWLSEHHNLNILQGSTPEVLLAAIGAQTTRIRLGSGGIVPQGQPKIARSFNCGYASTIRFKSRRDGRSFLSGIGRLCRPSGTNPIGTQNPRLKPWAIIGRRSGACGFYRVKPAVKTAGYFHPSPRDYRPHQRRAD